MTWVAAAVNASIEHVNCEANTFLHLYDIPTYLWKAREQTFHSGCRAGCTIIVLTEQMCPRATGFLRSGTLESLTLLFSCNKQGNLFEWRPFMG